MREWHVPFHVIETEWTEQQFVMFVRAMIRRDARERAAQKSNKTRGRGGHQRGAPVPYS